MESCARVIAMLPEFVEGEFPFDASSRIGSHLQSCRACRHRVEGHRRTLEALESLPQVVPTPELRSAVMQLVRSQPLPVTRGADRHLRLINAFFWTAFFGIATLASGAGALLLARASFGRASLADPTLLTEWLIALGQLAFSFVLNVATRTGIPSLLSAPRSIASWQGGVGWLLTLAATCLLMGCGILATARAVFRPRSR